MIPDLSVLWIIVTVLVLVAVLNGFLFKPILRVMRQREGAIQSARELAKESAAKAEAAAAAVEAKIAAARGEIYREMDEQRREALEWRTVLLADTKHEAEASLARATSALKEQADRARAELAQDAGVIADAIIERVLGRRAS